MRNWQRQINAEKNGRQTRRRNKLSKKRDRGMYDKKEWGVEGWWKAEERKKQDTGGKTMKTDLGTGNIRHMKGQEEE